MIRGGLIFGPQDFAMIAGEVFAIVGNHVPVVLQGRRQQFRKPPRPSGQEVGGSRALGHVCHVRLAVGTVAQGHKVAMQRNAFDAQTVGTLQYRRIDGVEVCLGNRLIRLTMFTAVRRPGGNAHAFAESVRRLMATHVNDVDFEIRIGGVVIDHGEWHIRTVLPRAFKTGKAHIIFNIVLTRNESLEFAFRRGHRQHQHFGGGFGTGADHDIALIKTDANAHPEPFIGFSVHAHIRFDRRANTMPPHSERPPGIVQFHPEHPLAVRREACAANAGELFGQFADRLPGLQPGKVANAEIISLVSRNIHAVQHPTAVLAQIQAAEPEEVMSLGFLVRIKNDLFTGHGAGRALRIHDRRVPVIGIAHGDAALHAILFALLRAGEVPVIIDARGNRHISLFHMRFQLFKQRMPEIRQMRHATLAVLVFGSYVAAHIIGVFVSHPLVIVFENVTVEFAALRLALGVRRHRGRGVCALVSHTTRL